MIGFLRKVSGWMIDLKSAIASASIRFQILRKLPPQLSRHCIMTLEDTLSQLQALGNPTMLAHNKKFGTGDNPLRVISIG